MVGCRIRAFGLSYELIKEAGGLLSAETSPLTSMRRRSVLSKQSPATSPAEIRTYA